MQGLYHDRRQRRQEGPSASPSFHVPAFLFACLASLGWSTRPGCPHKLWSHNHLCSPLSLCHPFGAFVGRLGPVGRRSLSHGLAVCRCRRGNGAYSLGCSDQSADSGSMRCRPCRSRYGSGRLAPLSRITTTMADKPVFDRSGVFPDMRRNPVDHIADFLKKLPEFVRVHLHKRHVVILLSLVEGAMQSP